MKHNVEMKRRRPALMMMTKKGAQTFCNWLKLKV